MNMVFTFPNAGSYSKAVKLCANVPHYLHDIRLQVNVNTDNFGLNSFTVHQLNSMSSDRKEVI